jgi:hypothetical protein
MANFEKISNVEEMVFFENPGHDDWVATVEQFVDGMYRHYASVLTDETYLYSLADLYQKFTDIVRNIKNNINSEGQLHQKGDILLKLSEFSALFKPPNTLPDSPYIQRLESLISNIRKTMCTNKLTNDVLDALILLWSSRNELAKIPGTYTALPMCRQISLYISLFYISLANITREERRNLWWKCSMAIMIPGTDHEI